MDLSNVRIFNRFEGYTDGSVKFMNDAIEELTGYAKEEFNEKRVNWTGIIHPDDHGSTKEAFKCGLRGNKTYDREYRIITKAGDVKWLIEMSRIICHPDGSINYVIGVLLDTTHQRMAEEEEARLKRLGGKFLSFRLGREEFGIKIDTIREIIKMPEITILPDAPEFIKGVVNLRGRVVPVVNLSLRLGLPEPQNHDRTCIIITELNDGLDLIGVVADRVSDITHIRGEEIDDEVQHRLQAEHVLGAARTAKGVKILLDLNRILRREELVLWDQAVPELQEAAGFR